MVSLSVAASFDRGHLNISCRLCSVVMLLLLIRLFVCNIEVNPSRKKIETVTKLGKPNCRTALTLLTSQSLFSR